MGVLYKTGKEFDSSWSRNEPFTTALTSGSVIPGWVQGIPGMKVGGRRELIIPASLAYGKQGSGLRRSRLTRRFVFVRRSAVDFLLAASGSSVAARRRARYSETGSGMPLSLCLRAKDQSNRSRVASRTSFVHRTMPGRAAPVTLLARLTAWP